MPASGRDRADREAVVAAKQDRQAASCQLAVHRVVYQPVPGRDLGEVPIAIHGRKTRIAGPAEVATIDDLDALRFERLLQAGDTQRLRAHRRASRAGADVRRSTDE